MSVDSAAVPPLKRGWLRKQARSALMRNWQNRYFVLDKGKISYYQGQQDRYPYGDNLKGELMLQDAVLANDKKKYGDKQVYIVGDAKKGQKDMLMEAESAAEAQEWSDAILQHIRFASSLDPAAAANSPAPRFNNKAGNRDSSATERFTTDALNESDVSFSALASASGSDLQGGLRADFPVTPTPGWVIKLIRTNSEKIFVNLCEAAEVPMVQLSLSIGYSKWPFMIVTPLRTVFDDKVGERTEVSVYDAIVNPAVVAMCSKNTEAKDATCMRVLRLLKKQYGEDIQPEYKLPIITKRYKGEITPVMMPHNVSTLAKSRSSIHVDYASKGRKGSATAVPGGAVAAAASAASATSSGPPSSAATDRRERSGSDLDVAGRPPLAVSAPQVTPLNPNSYSSSSSSATATAAAGLQAARPPMASAASVRGLRSSISGAEFMRQKSVSAVDSMSLNSALDSGSLAAVSTPGAGGSAASKLFLDANVGQSRRNSELRMSTSAELSRAQTETPFSSVSSIRANAIRNSMRSATNQPLMDRAQMMASGSGPVPMEQRLVVPYQIVRSNGTVVKMRPDKTSSGKVLGHGVRVFVVARRVLPENIAWLRTTEGWAMEKVFTGSAHRVLAPTLYGQPTGVKVVTTRFEDANASNLRASYSGRNTMVRESGWMAFRPSAIKESFQTRMTLDIFFKDRAVVRLTRTLGEILALRNALLNFPDKVIKDRATKAGEVPSVSDGDEELIVDVHLLLSLVESIETWMTRLFATLPLERCKCKALLDFLVPKEADFHVIETELMAEGGIGGAWVEEANECKQDNPENQ